LPIQVRNKLISLSRISNAFPPVNYPVSSLMIVTGLRHSFGVKSVMPLALPAGGITEGGLRSPAIVQMLQ
jgi:hypothetical protein